MIKIKKETLIKHNDFDISMLTHSVYSVIKLNINGSNLFDTMEDGKAGYKIGNKIQYYDSAYDLMIDQCRLYTKYTIPKFYENERYADELISLHKLLNYEDNKFFLLMPNSVYNKGDKGYPDLAHDIIKKHQLMFTKEAINIAYTQFFNEFTMREYDERILALFYSEAFSSIRLMLLHDYIYFSIKNNFSETYYSSMRILLTSITRNLPTCGGSLEFIRPIMESLVTELGQPGYLAVNLLEIYTKNGSLSSRPNLVNVVAKRNIMIQRLNLDYVDNYESINYTFGESYFIKNGEDNFANSIQSTMVINNIMNRVPVDIPVNLTTNSDNSSLISNVNEVNLRTVTYVDLVNKYTRIKEEIPYMKDDSDRDRLMHACRNLLNEVRLSEKEYVSPIEENNDYESANEMSILAVKIADLADEIVNTRIYYGTGEYNPNAANVSYEMTRAKSTFMIQFKVFKNLIWELANAPLIDFNKIAKKLKTEFKILLDIVFPIKAVSNGLKQEIKHAVKMKESMDNENLEYETFNMISLCEEFNSYVEYKNKEESNLIMPVSEGLDITYNIKKGFMSIMTNAILAILKTSKNEKHINGLKDAVISSLQDTENKVEDKKYKNLINEKINLINTVAEERLSKIYKSGEAGPMSYEIDKIKNSFSIQFKVFKNAFWELANAPLIDFNKIGEKIKVEFIKLLDIIIPYVKDKVSKDNKEIPTSEAFDLMYNAKKAMLTAVVEIIVSGIKISKNKEHIKILETSIIGSMKDIYEKIDNKKYKTLVNEKIKQVEKISKDRLAKIESESKNGKK